MRRISLRTALESPDKFTLAAEVYKDKNLVLNRGTRISKPVVAALYKLGIFSILVNEDFEEESVAVVPPTDEEIVKLVLQPVEYIPGEVDNIELRSFRTRSKYKEIYDAGTEALRHADIDTVIDVSRELADKISTSASILSELEALQQGCDAVISHSLNVATMAIAVGLSMGMKSKEVELLGAAGMLHDVGKLYIDRKILDKPAKLTDSEYAFMKYHARIGGIKLTLKKGIDQKIRMIAMQHHENNDGTGYPHGVKGDNILLESRIVHICDVYEAMIAKRIYKEGMLPGMAMEFIMSKCGTMFDKDILEAFVHTVPAYKTGDKVVLSSGESALVIHGTQKNSLRPVIRLDEGGDIIDLYSDKKYLNRTITGIRLSYG